MFTCTRFFVQACVWDSVRACPCVCVGSLHAPTFRGGAQTGTATRGLARLRPCPTSSTSTKSPAWAPSVSCTSTQAHPVPEPAPGPRRASRKARVLPRKCYCTQYAQQNLFRYAANISCLNHAFKLRSPASLTGTRPASTKPLL